MSVWAGLKSMITAPPPPPQATVPVNRRTKRTNDVPQDAKALQKTQRTALGDISNRTDGVQQVTKRATRVAQPTKAPIQDAPVIPAPPVPKMTTVYPTVALPQPVALVVPSEPTLVADAKGATIPQALSSPDPMSIDILDHAQHAAASAAPTTAALITSPMATSQLAFEDIDKDAVDDPQQCAEYVNDIYAYLREMEVRYRPSRMYLEGSKDMTPRMRAILVDWLVELAEEYHLSNETLHLTVCYLDRFLAINTVPRTELQLVGIACCLIASKFEEVHPPVIDDFLYISENAYTREQIVECESHILNALQFNLAMVTIRAFLRRFLKAANANQRTCFLAGYIAELALLEYSCIKFLPSLIATCSICLALHSQGLESWTDTIAHYTEYQLNNPYFQECLRTLQALYRGAEKSCFQAIRSKHSHSAYLKVALLRPVQ